jgi:hypothetical protein
MVDPDPVELKIAIRRVESAVYAFGGYVQTSSTYIDQQDGGKVAAKTKSSIFRRLPSKHAADVPKFNGGTSHPTSHQQRYVIKGHGISWEVEENTPIDRSATKPTVRMMTNQRQIANNLTKTGKASPEEVDTNDMDMSSEQDQNDAPISPSFASPPSGTVDTTPTSDRNQKMTYHCKLCGQPKQNHSCPFRSSLQRSIAISVVPVVNGYTAEEPGILTPALSEMNNFVSYAGSSSENAVEGEDDDFVDDDDVTTYHSKNGFLTSPAQVTPIDGIVNAGGVHHSPQNSSLSSSAPTPDRIITPGTQRRVTPKPTTSKLACHRGKKRPKDVVTPPAAATTTTTGTVSAAAAPRPRLFAETLTLRPEHYRAVTSPKKNGSRKKSGDSGSSSSSSSSGMMMMMMDEAEGFEYPPIPVSFQGRKRLSDTLFYLSKSIPSITTDVASLLRTAREREDWDLAVAEILTQVVVALHCAEGDHRLDGLRQYLLNLGIST